jgi:hypothetical protein
MHASFTYGFFLALGRKRKMSMIYVLWWVLHTLLLPGPTFMRGFLFSVRTWFLSFHVPSSLFAVVNHFLGVVSLSHFLSCFLIEW